MEAISLSILHSNNGYQFGNYFKRYHIIILSNIKKNTCLHESIKALDDVPLHYHPIKCKQPIIRSFSAIVVDGDGKLCLL